MNESGVFAWAYLPGSDLKARLTYPNGLTAEWAYEPGRDLLTAVTNSLPDGTTLSTYVYANDLLGRRVSKNDEQYGYDLRDQLTSAEARSYAYDDIGNRTVAEGRAYAANALNQYTAIDAFVPEYDADGNQTKVLTDTGVWAVEYNAENRPIRWTQGNKVITMGFDRMGRRVFYKEMSGNRQVTYTKFLYNGYLCIQQLFSNSPWNVYKEFIWDPTEPVATRPLCFRQNAKRATFLLHDGNKNVTDVVTVGPFNEPVAHYDYAPFGAVTATGSRAADNPFRFSSEFHDPTLALVYYNYRHYNPLDGRWLGRDPLKSTCSPYGFVGNSPLIRFDRLGLTGVDWSGYRILDTPPEGTPPYFGAYTEMLPVIYHALEDKGTYTCVSKVMGDKTCFRCLFYYSTSYATIEFSSNSWVLRSELNNRSLRKHEANLLAIAKETAQRYTPKAKALRGQGCAQQESEAKSLAKTDYEKKEQRLYAELVDTIERETMEYEQNSSFGRNEWE